VRPAATFIAALATIAACSPGASGPSAMVVETASRNPSLTASPSPIASAHPAQAIGSADEWFPPITGFTWRHAPRAGRDFEDAADESIGDLSSSRVQAAARASRGHEQVTVIAYALQRGTRYRIQSPTDQ
jgi:cell wall-associated NlpC family hydrolase